MSKAPTRYVTATDCNATIPALETETIRVFTLSIEKVTAITLYMLEKVSKDLK